MKLKRSVVLPLLLLVYLAVMARIGWPDYVAGRISALSYYGAIAGTLTAIVLLHFNLKYREKRRNKK